MNLSDRTFRRELLLAIRQHLIKLGTRRRRLRRTRAKGRTAA